MAILFVQLKIQGNRLRIIFVGDVRNQTVADNVKTRLDLGLGSWGDHRMFVIQMNSPNILNFLQYFEVFNQLL